MKRQNIQIGCTAKALMFRTGKCHKKGGSCPCDFNQQKALSKPFKHPALGPRQKVNMCFVWAEQYHPLSSQCGIFLRSCTRTKLIGEIWEVRVCSKHKANIFHTWAGQITAWYHTVIASHWCCCSECDLPQLTEQHREWSQHLLQLQLLASWELWSSQFSQAEIRAQMASRTEHTTAMFEGLWLKFSYY